MESVTVPKLIFPTWSLYVPLYSHNVHVYQCWAQDLGIQDQTVRGRDEDQDQHIRDQD